MTEWGGPDPIDPVRELKPYQTPVPAGPIDLDLAGNEGSTPPLAVLEALAGLDAEDLRTYPDLSQLRAAIADSVGVSPAQVLVTAGGDQAIDLLARTFLEPDTRLLTHTPSFVMIERAARFAGADVTAIDWASGAFPTDAFVEAAGPDAPLAIVVSPNNPTGATLDEAAFRRLADELAPALLVVDHAYVEFSDADLTAVALEAGNAAVIRTFSKAYGLAGCRVGYLVGPTQLVDYLERIRSPYPLASPAIAAATARLAADDDVEGYIESVRTNRRQLETHLDALGVEAYPSAANFVLGGFPDPRWAFDGLAGLGIRTRLFPDRPGLERHLRITVPGAVTELERLERALTAVLAPEAVLLDMDGVIADVSESYREAIIRTAADFDVGVDHADIQARKQAGDANDDWQLTHQLVRDAGVDAAFEDVKAAFEAHYLGRGQAPDTLYKRERLIGGNAIDRLGGEHRLGIVTGRPRRDADRFLEHTGIADRFEAVVCKEDATDKPDPEPVGLALDRLGCDHAWLIGDTPDDIRAARRADVVPIGVVAPGEDTRAAKTAMLEAGAARVVDDLDAVATLLDEALPGR